MLTAIALDSEMTARAVLRRLARNGLWLDPGQAEAAAHIREHGPESSTPGRSTKWPAGLRDPAQYSCAIRRQFAANILWYARPASDVLRACARATRRETAGRPEPARIRQPANSSGHERRVRTGRRRRPRWLAAGWRGGPRIEGGTAAAAAPGRASATPATRGGLLPRDSPCGTCEPGHALTRRITSLPRLHSMSSSVLARPAGRRRRRPNHDGGAGGSRQDRPHGVLVCEGVDAPAVGPADRGSSRTIRALRAVRFQLIGRPPSGRCQSR